ncbi:MAG: hypothetical protein KJ674_04610 [Nanoarchaeota archaeon]|nr:hypothetical protein [Nanoarchaeota archaeon]
MSDNKLNLEGLSSLELLIHVPIILFCPDEGKGPNHIKVGRRKHIQGKAPLIVYPVEKESRMLLNISMNTYNSTVYPKRKSPEIQYILMGDISQTVIGISFDVRDPVNQQHMLGFEIHTEHDDTIPRFEKYLDWPSERIIYEKVSFNEYHRLKREFEKGLVKELEK